MKSLRYSLLGLLVFSFLAGCGKSEESPKAIIKGRLLDQGKPFSAEGKIKLPKKGTTLPPGVTPLQITFIPLDAGESYIATIRDAATGAFELTGSDGKGVRLAKYKVSVQINTGPGTPDALGGKYSPERTPLRAELKEGQELVIDVSKPNG